MDAWSVSASATADLHSTPEKCADRQAWYKRGGSPKPPRDNQRVCVMTQKLDTAANIATIAACGMLIALAVPRFRTDSGTKGVTKAAVLSVANTETRMPAQFEGDLKAEVALIEFSDFQCPYCGKYARETLPILKREFVDRGALLIGFRNYPLSGVHPNATGAAMAAICAGEQRRFWQMHDRLFADQKSLDPPNLISSATVLGLSMPSFTSCTSTTSAASQRLHDDVQEAQRLNVTSTPTFLLGTIERGNIVKVHSLIAGNKPLATFEQAIKAEIDRQAH